MVIGTASFEVELEEVEECTRDEGTEEKTTSALNHALEGHDQFHVCGGCGMVSGLVFLVGGFSGLGHGIGA